MRNFSDILASINKELNLNGNKLIFHCLDFPISKIGAFEDAGFDIIKNPPIDCDLLEVKYVIAYDGKYFLIRFFNN